MGLPIMTVADLVRSDPGQAGIRRRRCGRGFRYFDAQAVAITDAETLARIKALVIPPAWEDVWICPDAEGHIQAIGTDAAGRRQYRYHDLWRERRDREKHDRVLGFGEVLPRVRKTVERHLDGSGLGRERVLAAAIRLIDLGFFRPGGEEYTAENGTYGLATIRREHVVCSRNGELVFEYVAKGSQHREQAVVDDQVLAVVKSLKRRRSGGEELLAYRDGRRWHDVTAGNINDYLREISGGDFTAKDFRTWHATVLAAVGLAVSEAAETAGARKRAVARVVREVADYLGNTPAVARASYIDPRVIELYEEGTTIERTFVDLGKDSTMGELATRGPAEEAVLKILTAHAGSR
jgi:DNA topoisomerase IB